MEPARVDAFQVRSFVATCLCVRTTASRADSGPTVAGGPIGRFSQLSQCQLMCFAVVDQFQAHAESRLSCPNAGTDPRRRSRPAHGPAPEWPVSPAAAP